MEQESVEKMLEKYQGTDLLDADVYRVGHHGSVNATTEPLVETMSPDFAVFSMGAFDRQLPHTGWAYAHPRREVVQMLQEHISTSRPAIQVKAGKKGASPDHGAFFVDLNVDKALYATGWDGTVALEATPEGKWTVLSPADQVELVNINAATAEELEALPMIGRERAGAIVAYRQAQGPFGSVDELLEVQGIGPATLAAIRDFCICK
jgi:competence ComEA-like helix-hairpin-helix protein